MRKVEAEEVEAEEAARALDMLGMYRIAPYG